MDMKKVLFSIAIVFVVTAMVSCGSKTAKGGDNDSTAVADSMATTSAAELWTEEAVEAQIRKMYDRLNEMGQKGEINITKLEDEFCSSYYLNLRNAIHKAIEGATGDDQMFFGDEEGYRFFAGMSTPMEIENIKADLLTGDMAQAQVRFKGADEENGFMRLELDLENGAWRVKNFDQPEAFGPGGILKIMEDFALEHGISYEESVPAGASTEQDKAAVRAFVEQFYKEWDKTDLLDYDYVKQYITSKLRKYLADAYDYDCEGECLATWKFFYEGGGDVSGLESRQITARDGSHVLVQSKYGNYEYDVLLTVVKDGDKFKIDGLKQEKSEYTN